MVCSGSRSYIVKLCDVVLIITLQVDGDQAPGVDTEDHESERQTSTDTDSQLGVKKSSDTNILLNSTEMEPPLKKKKKSRLDHGGVDT